MPPDPNTPTPGTENLIDYDAIEKLARDFVRIYGEFRCDLAAVLFLVSKARQRDEAVVERDAALSLAASRLARIEALTTDLEREKAGTDALREALTYYAEMGGTTAIEATTRYMKGGVER